MKPNQLAFELALRAEIDQRWRAYRKMPNAVEVALAGQTEPKSLVEAVRVIAIASSTSQGIELEGKVYRWTIEDGLMVSPVRKKRPPPSDDALWWD